MNGTKDLVAVRCDVELDAPEQVVVEGHTLTLNLEDASVLADLLTSCKEKRNANIKPQFMLYLVGISNTAIHLDGDRLARIEQGLDINPLSKRVGFVSRDPAFWCYLESVNFLGSQHSIDENVAKQTIHWICRIESRRQLDHQEEAAQRYLTLIERPFLKWLKGQQVLARAKSKESLEL